MSHNIILILLIVFSSCSQIKTIRHNKINIKDAGEAKLLHCYKNKPMNGVFKIRYGFGHGYSIETFQNGLLHGKSLSYNFRYLYLCRNLYLEENYQNGLLTGDCIDYSDGVKKTQCTYKDGLPNGMKLVFGENGKDTIRSLLCATTPFKMDIYVDNPRDTEVDGWEHILFAVQLCTLKAEEFVQSYYLKKDSTLLERIVWMKKGTCAYIRKE